MGPREPKIDKYRGCQGTLRRDDQAMLNYATSTPGYNKTSSPYKFLNGLKTTLKVHGSI